MLRGHFGVHGQVLGDGTSERFIQLNLTERSWRSVSLDACEFDCGHHLGSYIKDVRTEGGRGGLRIARFCGQIVLIGCVKCGRRGEGG